MMGRRTGSSIFRLSSKPGFANCTSAKISATGGREDMSVRMSGGQPSYPHVVTVRGPGKIVYPAGQLARDIDGNCVGKGDMRAQMEQTFKNLDQCLKAAGATWADVVKTNFPAPFIL